MRNFFICLILFTCAISLAFGQKEGNTWYFGSRAGISFNSGIPQPLANSAMSTLEGCATISDGKGKLLFYTDGVNVYNASHTKMPNGSGLKGSPSSTQSAVAVPYPGKPGIYYLFTVDAEAGEDGLRYSLIDMSLDNGLGDVKSDTKNVLLRTPVAEKLTAVMHANKQSIWVLAHGWGSTDFYAYLISPGGLMTTPVISKVGAIHARERQNSIGYMKVASGGTRLAWAVAGSPGWVDVMDFDNATGSLKNNYTINNLDKPYGIEFSPDNSKLYVSCINDKAVYQYDLLQKDIAASQYKVGENQEAPAALQLAPDRRIYVAIQGGTSLDVINRPNKAGADCKYENGTFYLGGKVSNSGLPTFIQSFFIPLTDFEFDNGCFGEAVKFRGQSSNTPDSWWWDFGDPQTASANYSSLQEPSHNFSAAGNYTVTMVIGYKGQNDTIIKEVEVYPKPVVDLGKDRTVCAWQPLQLDAGNPGLTYLWSTGDTTRTLQLIESGKYWVQVANGSCVVSDTVQITYIPADDLRLGNDTLACSNTPVVLSKKIPGAVLKWSTGDTTSSITVTKTGAYWLQVSLGSCVLTDTIIVFFTEPAKLDLGRDTMLCEGETDTLDAGIRGLQYLWSTGETTQKIVARGGGDYWVAVKAGPCTSYDTLHITPCSARIFAPSAFSPNNNNMNEEYRLYTSDILKAEWKIANRWGNIVYESHDLGKGWDGRYKGMDAPIGRYVWTLKYDENVKGVIYTREATGAFYLVH